MTPGLNDGSFPTTAKTIANNAIMEILSKTFKLDALLLMCTHYSLFVEEFGHLLVHSGNQNSRIIDPSETAARMIAARVQRTEAKVPDIRVIFTGQTEDKVVDLSTTEINRSYPEGVRIAFETW